MANNALEKIISQNKKAFHDYFIDEKYECGIVLTGTEIKAIRNGKVNLQDSFCYIKLSTRTGCGDTPPLDNFRVAIYSIVKGRD